VCVSVSACDCLYVYASVRVCIQAILLCFTQNSYVPGRTATFHAERLCSMQNAYLPLRTAMFHAERLCRTQNGDVPRRTVICVWWVFVSMCECVSVCRVCVCGVWCECVVGMWIFVWVAVVRVYGTYAVGVSMWCVNGWCVSGGVCVCVAPAYTKMSLLKIGVCVCAVCAVLVCVCVCMYVCQCAFQLYYSERIGSYPNNMTLQERIRSYKNGSEPTRRIWSS